MFGSKWVNLYVYFMDPTIAKEKRESLGHFLAPKVWWDIRVRIT